MPGNACGHLKWSRHEKLSIIAIFGTIFGFNKY